MSAVCAAPVRSTEQRFEALLRANEIRSYRAQLKRDLAAGRVTLAELLEGEPRDLLLTMKVYELLMATPKIGRVKVNKLLSMARMSPSKTLGGMSERQRTELLMILRARAAQPRRVRERPRPTAMM